MSAILFPVFAKVRESARQIVCASNEKQIGLGIMQYIQDNDEHYPLRAVGVAATGDFHNWKAVVYPYIKSHAVFRCPNINLSYAYDYGYRFGGGAGHGDFLSYQTNQNPSFGVIVAGVAPVGLAQLDAPASTIMISESESQEEAIDITDSVHFTLFAGHTEKTNYLFADGHVKALIPLATVGAANGGAGSVNMWNRNPDQPDFAGGTTSGDGAGAFTILSKAAGKYK